MTNLNLIYYGYLSLSQHPSEEGKYRSYRQLWLHVVGVVTQMYSRAGHG